MYSVHDDHKWSGFPIRKSTDQSLLTAPHGLSQRATSFIASQCQGIHQMPFRHLIVLITTMHHRLAFRRMMFAISLPLAARLAAKICHQQQGWRQDQLLKLSDLPVYPGG
jgi:hypothetical protein